MAVPSSASMPDLGEEDLKNEQNLYSRIPQKNFEKWLLLHLDLGDVEFENQQIPLLQHSSGGATAEAASPRRNRNRPGNPNSDAVVVALSPESLTAKNRLLSPESLTAKNRFICELCDKGFPREQNLQLHRRGHNLPWKLKKKTDQEVQKKVYICPEIGCAHHDPARALRDLTGIKKFFARKQGEKKFSCTRCHKRYAVLSDLKAHSKICGTKEYKCECGTTFYM